MRTRWLSLLFAFCGLGVLIAGYIFLPRAAAAGWLIAFDFCAGVVLGSLGLALISRITGGAWYEALAPATASAVLLVPALLIAIIPVFGSAGFLFHWNAIRPGVGALWLNAPGHVARSVVLLLLLSGFALWRGRGLSMAAAAAGLVLYAFAFSVFAIDWVYAVRAQTMYTAFGAFLAVSNLATALAFAILLTRRLPPRIASDLSGVLIAMVLGSLYLEFMDFMIAWYGDVPARIAWYATRATWPWPVLLWAALIFGAFGPLFVLLASRTRFLALPLRFVAAAILIGAFAYDTWLIVPEFGWPALGFAAAGVLVLAALAVSFVRVRAQAAA
ncbi:MAG TPA: hypothetical protein VGL35_04365 [Rhizomicrobium sp.]|jgi:hypothetical protein